MPPSVSVIIPTAGRPQYLPRAVKSALADMRPGEVEVIVVPNGPDESWKESLKPYFDNPSVRIIPIPEANANIARNTGLAAAKGEFVRFLDDDDYLIPDGARKQYDLITKTSVDVVCGEINVVNPVDEIIRIFRPPKYDDFCLAVASPEGLYLPHAYVYRKKSLNGMRWNPKISNRQDLCLLVDLCKAGELHWQRCDYPVGAWQHHWGSRITLTHSSHAFHEKAVRFLIGLYNILKKNKRLNPERRKALAQSLWSSVHAAFHLNPGYWTRIAKFARKIDPQARPVQNVYNWPVIRLIDPLHMQWLLWPKRRFNHLKRNWHYELRSGRYW